MKLKVCGITSLEQLQQLQELGADYAGLIFYEKSKRYAHEKLQSFCSAIKELNLTKVGVFVNTGMDFLKSCIADYGLDAVQLHGDETPEYCAAVQKEAMVIKVFRISNATNDIDALIAPYQDVCSYFLFDTDTAAYGGSGKRFNWSLLQKARINKPFFLSGGIGPDDVDNIKTFSHPYFYAVDVNSRFENSPGIKDMDLVKRFATEFKQPAIWIK
jgi:phosphoribosylanthranilate isomerase